MKLAIFSLFLARVDGGVRSDFHWGVATAAYQIEGATMEDGRGPSIWDTFTAIPGKIRNGDNGTRADDSYHKIVEDIQLIKAMGLRYYRLSISWSRILPTGQLPINQQGIDHYNQVFDELKKADIIPVVTLYHWDLPQGLEDLYGGWLSPSIEQDFVTYADVVFSAFGDRVKLWTTMNEPWSFCVLGYVRGMHVCVCACMYMYVCVCVCVCMRDHDE